MGKCISCFVSTPDSADHQYVEPVCAGGTEVVTNETSNKADLQNLMNEQTRMINTNVHLGKGKCKAEHHELNYGNFKRIKLDNHSNTRFRTSKKPFRENSTWGTL